MPASGAESRPRRAAAFALGWSVVVAALVSPLDPLGGRLFWVHMVQHELLMVAAAPLLVIAHPAGRMGVGVAVDPAPARRRSLPPSAHGAGHGSASPRR
jgi:cytochrome c oxidase assembly factor CtaG